MKVDNRHFGIDNLPCARDANALFARGAAGWRRGYAADCKSASQNPISPSKIKPLTQTRTVDKTDGHSANAPETLTTGWWLLPSAILGAFLWAWGVVGVMG